MVTEPPYPLEFKLTLKGDPNKNVPSNKRIERMNEGTNEGSNNQQGPSTLPGLRRTRRFITQSRKPDGHYDTGK